MSTQADSKRPERGSVAEGLANGDAAAEGRAGDVDEEIDLLKDWEGQNVIAGVGNGGGATGAAGGIAGADALDGSQVRPVDGSPVIWATWAARPSVVEALTRMQSIMDDILLHVPLPNVPPHAPRPPFPPRRPADGGVGAGVQPQVAVEDAAMGDEDIVLGFGEHANAGQT